MADEQGFAHIKLTTPVQADEVVYAGLSRSDELEAEASSDERDLEALEAVVVEEVSEEVADDSLEDKAERAARKPVSKQSNPQRKAQRNDSYRETTLDDLKGGKAPLAQKLVIIAAIVLIIVAIVYYFTVLR